MKLTKKKLRKFLNIKNKTLRNFKGGKVTSQQRARLKKAARESKPSSSSSQRSIELASIKKPTIDASANPITKQTQPSLTDSESIKDGSGNPTRLLTSKKTSSLLKSDASGNLTRTSRSQKPKDTKKTDLVLQALSRKNKSSEDDKSKPKPASTTITPGGKVRGRNLKIKKPTQPPKETIVPKAQSYTIKPAQPPKGVSFKDGEKKSILKKEEAKPVKKSEIKDKSPPLKITTNTSTEAKEDGIEFVIKIFIPKGSQFNVSGDAGVSTDTALTSIIKQMSS